MPRTLCALLLALCLALPADAATRSSHILLETSLGDILIELNHRRAPLTTARIVELTDEGHYDGLIFHRVIPGFVAQTGGFTRALEPRNPEATIVNESGNGLRNRRGKVALARGNEPHSGTGQIYFNLDDNDSLDPSSRRWGYAVFGRVIAGMEVLDTMAEIPTGARPPLPSDVPEQPIVVERAVGLDRDAALEWIIAWEEARMEKENEQ
ncbi:peptidylprolyl isomerase [Natronospira bacteriovora]|uniref:Peptidyl-prolyl cis-trans isomerase n=1 Tax=Natronospira bacteriovora TaxID=3069753 RepID=A0ABU0W648_9GAMM|nr:peptidylprolyl isomerase [Natronospira sp. AB-CW4]MDQ2068935.1 peptidylprolyl isomerase [Natronospira sp. AB-CW4]